MVIDVARQEWRADAGAIDAVAVDLGARRGARMESWRDFLDAKHAHGGGQGIVQRNHEIRFWYRRIGLPGCDLTERMNAGIGSSGALRNFILAGHALQRFRQDSLHRPAAWLHLPAVKFRAVIAKRDLQIAHATFRSPREMPIIQQPSSPRRT